MKPNPDSVFSASVRKRLTEAGLSSAQFAALIGKSQSFVSQMTNGAYRPSPEWVNRLADLFKLNEDERFNLHMDACIDRGFFCQPAKESKHE